MTTKASVDSTWVIIALLLSCFSSTRSIQIGFTHREQTVYEGLYFDNFPQPITIHTDVEPEIDYLVVIRPIPEIRTNNVAKISPFAIPGLIPCDADVKFGQTELEEAYLIRSGQTNTTLLSVNIINDFLVEEEECFTLQLFPHSSEDNFTCSDDNEDSEDYFCHHTICIQDDDDPNAPFNVVFEENSYSVTEGETLTVCIEIFSSTEQESATFDDVYTFITLATSNNQPLQALNSDFQFVYGIETPLTPTERKICFDVITFNDTILELMETTILTLCIDDGGTQTVALPTTNKAYLNIIDNNEAQIGLEMAEYSSNNEICLTLRPISSFSLEVLLIIQAEGEQNNTKSVVFPVGQTEVCTPVCNVAADNTTFEISLSQTEDFNPKIHFVPEQSVATVHNIVGSDVGIAWEENDYIVTGTSVVTACVIVYSTLSLREVTITMEIIPEGGNVTQYTIQLMSVLGERGCIDIDVRDTQCRNAVLTVSSDDSNVCILTESSSFTIDINNTFCAPTTVGYEKMEYLVPASTTVKTIEFCAVISSPASKVALRPFSLEVSAPVNFGGLINYQAIGDQQLSFGINDSRQCHQFTIEIISSHNVCDDFSMNIFTWVLSLRTGDSEIIIQPNSAKLIITDSDDPQCAPIYVGYSEMSYITMEGEGAIVCIEITSHSNEGAPRPFVVMLTTKNGTADYDDFIQSSQNILFEVGDISQCVILSSISDNICEYSECTFEYFMASLSTNDRHVFVAQPVTKIEIEEDITTLNCSELFTDCMSPPPSSDSSNNKLPFYLYIFVPIGVALILIIIVVVIVIVLIQQKKKKTISLPKYHYRNAADLGKLPQDKSYIAFNEIHNAIPKSMIFTKDSIHLSNIVGQGEAGVVYKAFLETKNGRDLVAIKTVKALFAGSDVNRLIKEIKVMVSFNHPNVMTLRGVCLDQENPLLIMPFMSNGSVLEYVKHHRNDFMLTEEVDELQITTARKKMLGICLQVAKGMHYLAEERIVHRDLAARNCMIDMNDVIKVADFGLTEDIYASEYFRRNKSNVSSDEKVPLRWMAPESISSDLYNEKTDVWSFGVTCWEVFTCGQVPYRGIPVMRLFNTLNSGERLDKPNNSACSDEIFSVIKACWNKAADERPNFKLVVEQISNVLEIEAGYVNFSDVQQMNN